MGWYTTEDLDEYLTAAGEFLRSRPVAHTVPLTIVESLSAGGGTVFDAEPPRYGWWRPTADSAVAGAFLQTPPHPALLSVMPEPAVAALPEALAAAGWTVPGITAGSAVVAGFAAAWQRHTGATPQVQMRQRLYSLGTLQPPQPPPPGGARLATDSDRDLLLAWYAAFADDAQVPRGNPASVVDDRLGHGGFTLWEVEGTPVSLGGRTRIVAGMARVAPIYTPPEHRRRGYAAAVTAAVSQTCLDAGAADVLLFTDLANPTSNGVYQRVGYRPVDDYLMLSLSTDSRPNASHLQE